MGIKVSEMPPVGVNNGSEIGHIIQDGVNSQAEVLFKDSAGNVPYVDDGLSMKYNKTGGTIDGWATIEGVLTVDEDSTFEKNLDVVGDLTADLLQAPNMNCTGVADMVQLNFSPSFSKVKYESVTQVFWSYAGFTTGWARGLEYRGTGEVLLGGIGVKGTGETIDYLYMGFGTEPWVRPGFRVGLDGIYGYDIPQGAGAESLTRKDWVESLVENTSHDRIDATPLYQFNASETGQDFYNGLQIGFSDSARGYPNFGSIVRGNTIDGQDGGSFEFYIPYGTNYGGDSIKYRSGQFNNAGWSEWKDFLDNKGDFTVDGQFTFTLPPKSNTDGVADEDLVNKRQLDVVQSNLDWKFNKRKVINTIDDFGTYDATTIQLEANTKYLLNAVVDIGNRVFEEPNPKGVFTITGKDPIMDKIVSSSSGTLFDTTDCDWFLGNIGIEAPNATLMDAKKVAGFSFNFLTSVDIDNVNSLGTVNAVNTFRWAGFSFISNTIGGLTVAGACDKIDITGITPDNWTGALIDITGTINTVTFKDFDVKFRALGQKIFSDNIDNSVTESGRIEGIRMRNHPDFPMNQTDFATTVLASFGGITTGDSGWELINNQLFPDTRKFADGATDEAITDSITTQNKSIIELLQIYGTINTSLFTVGTDTITYDGRDMLDSRINFSISGFNDNSRASILIVELVITSLYGNNVTQLTEIQLPRRDTFAYSSVSNLVIFPGDIANLHMRSASGNIAINIDNLDFYIG